MMLVWVVSVYLQNVSIVDLVWGPAIALAGLVYWLSLETPTLRAHVALIFVVIWALRLGVHLLRRNTGQPEDRRYVAIRQRNNPGFWWKSFYLVFLFQAVMAWIVSWSVFGAMTGVREMSWLDYAGMSLYVFGLVWESLADWQLQGFLQSRAGGDEVMDKGLWRYSRHPNYFGEFCLWWGMGFLAVSAGVAWTIISPLLLTLFLLKVSGVSLLEEDITERRPAYAEYVRRTSVFIPWLPRGGD